ncbi:acid phosphatase [Achromobacter pestifer]|nr:phosphatase PAP2 family protein [Achromobacter pestifer]
MHKISILGRALAAAGGLLSMTASGWLGAQPPSPATGKVTNPPFELAPGYLQRADLPNSLLLLGAPPSKDSAAFARDEEARKAALAQRETARWEMARRDADLRFPAPANNFSCAMGVRIDEQDTPRTYRLMHRVLTDAGLSTYGVKKKYNRTRPFALHDEGTCTPQDDEILRNDGSYPSGHTAVGWAWALVLAEINPQRANELLARGLAFGQSRVICNAHWQSDVDGGRVMGAATVSRLQSDAGFRADLDAAKQELKNIKAAGGNAPRDCAAETAASS